MATANAVILDTNVLVRYLVDLPGDELQCAAARKLVHAASKAVVPITVCCELVWVLQSQPTVTKPVLVA